MENTFEKQDCVDILNKLLGGEEVSQKEKQKLVDTYGLIIGFLLEHLSLEQNKIVKKENILKVNEEEKVFIKNVVSYLGLNSNKISRKMRKKHYTIDRAISDEVFRTSAIIKHKKVRLIYDYCVKKLGPFRDKDEYNEDFNISEYNKMQSMINDSLTTFERQKLIEVYDKCLNTLRNYQYLEIGLEKDIEKRKRLIKQYELTDDEITKSSMMSMGYELRLNRKEKNKKSERLQNIKSLIINWNKLDEERKELFIKEYEISNEELQLLTEYSVINNDNLGLFDSLIKENNISEDEIAKVKMMYASSIYSAELYPNERIA